MIRPITLSIILIKIAMNPAVLTIPVNMPVCTRIGFVSAWRPQWVNKENPFLTTSINDICRQNQMQIHKELIVSLMCEILYLWWRYVYIIMHSNLRNNGTFYQLLCVCPWKVNVTILLAISPKKVTLSTNLFRIVLLNGPTYKGQVTYNTDDVNSSPLDKMVAISQTASSNAY